jgi:hypothetical protein
MSAAEVIELIKKLPPEEKAEVIAFVRSAEAESTGPGQVASEAFRAAADKVFTQHRELFRKLAQ